MSSLDEYLNKATAGKRRGYGRVLFLRHKEQIQQYLDSGYSKKAIWDALSETEDFSLAYSQFTAYIKSYIEDHEAKPTKPSEKRSRSTKKASAAKKQEKQEDPFLKKVAKWNPKPMPLDELV